MDKLFFKTIFWRRRSYLYTVRELIVQKLSFLIDGNYKLSDFTVFHKGDDGWKVATDEIANLTYDGEYLSFIANVGGGYGYAVPEPSTYAIIFGGIALGFAMYRRRK